MLGRGWTGIMLSAVVFTLSARAAVAQESPTKDQEIEDLKRRLEALERQKDPHQALSGAAVVADPVEDKWYDRIKIGGGVRAEFNTVGHPLSLAPTANRGADFQLDDARLYMSGKISERLSMIVNTEFAAGVSVLDAIAQIHVADEFNVWTGRALPACDRSNFDGPFYLSVYSFPMLSVAYNCAGARTGLRQDGATFWGDVSKFKYWVGAYEGRADIVPGGPDALLYAARIQYDFLDSEAGFFLESTYYGEKKILAIGISANDQAHAVGPLAAGPRTEMFNAVFDVLFEERLSMLGDGVVTVEGDYYIYRRGGNGAGGVIGGGPPPAGALFNDLGEGDAVMFVLSFLIPQEVGWGKFQPQVRYQAFDGRPANALTTKNSDVQWDFGVNYVMKEHNARVSVLYTLLDQRVAAANLRSNMITLGTQFQF